MVAETQSIQAEPKQQAVDLTALIEQLQTKPELASTLAALIANGSSASC